MQVLYEMETANLQTVLKNELIFYSAQSKIFKDYDKKIGEIID